MRGRLNPLLLLDHLRSRGLWVSLGPLCRHPLLLWLLVLNWNLWRCVALSLGSRVALRRNLLGLGVPLR